MLTPKFVLRIDDIAPGMAWSKFAAIEAAALELNIPLLIGVVPDCRDPKLAVEPVRADFWDKVRQWHASGWTIAQHGYTHQYVTKEPGLMSVNRQSEFAGLSYEEQFAKLQTGKEILVREGVWQPVFMAPSHSFDDNTLRALVALGFEYITDGYGMYAYRIGGLTAVPQLFASPRHFGFGAYTMCLHPNNMNAGQLADLVAFMRGNQRRFVSMFDAAAIHCSVPFAAALLRLFTSAVLRQARLLRRR